MRNRPDLVLTLILLGSALAIGALSLAAGRRRTAGMPARPSPAELRRRFPAVYERIKGGYS